MAPTLLDPADRLAELEEEVERGRRRRDGWTLLIFMLATMALLLAAVALALSTGDDDGGAVDAAPSSVMVHLTDFAITPAEITVAEGGTLEVMNDGEVPHNLKVVDQDLATEMLDKGAAEDLALGDLPVGTYRLLCEVPGHESAGMVATLHIGGSDGGATEGAPAAGGSTGATWDQDATPAPEWHAFDPTLQPASGATVHDITFHATEKVIEVAPGVTQEMWTFNDQVPGPVLRGHVGDVFNVTLVNDGKVAHSIDFHASEVAPNVEMRTLQPGESLVYQFRAEHAGIWMYHCGTPPALHHIGNGMYGAVIIDPPALPKVDHELVMVQSELYFGPEGQPGDLAKMQAVTPDAVVFNGYANQYKLTPVRVEPGETVRVWVLDAGPSENSAFHIVGTVFDTVYKEGAYLLRPDATKGGSQVLDLQPAQGGFVEFTLDEVGLYPMVTHKFANVGKGALGLFQAGEVDTEMTH